jgi:hypothetical protein
MPDFETTKIIPQKTADISKLTDNFYYPTNSTNSSFRNISPIISKQDLRFARKTEKNENLDVSLIKNFA